MNQTSVLNISPSPDLLIKTLSSHLHYQLWSVLNEPLKSCQEPRCTSLWVEMTNVSCCKWRAAGCLRVFFKYVHTREERKMCQSQACWGNNNLGFPAALALYTSSAPKAPSRHKRHPSGQTVAVSAVVSSQDRTETETKTGTETQTSSTVKHGNRYNLNKPDHIQVYCQIKEFGKKHKTTSIT